MNLKVLFIGNFLSATRGSRSASETIAERLKAQDWEVLTTSPHPGRALRFMDILGTIWTQRNHFDIANIEVYSSLALVWAEASSLLLKWLKKPFILSLHGGGLPDLAKRSPGRIQQLLSRANAVTTPSLHVQESFQLFRSDLVYLPNGLDIERFSFRKRSAPLVRAVWLRAFHSIYNPCLAVEVTSRVQKRISDFHLDMIGPDQGDGTHAKAARLIVNLGLDQHITLTGSMQNKDVPRCLQEYDLFINTTRLESFGIAVMEAAAAGLPIVTTKVGELPYLWKHEHNAMLVPDGDAEAMAEAVIRIIQEPDLAKKLSANARANAEQFDWKNILPVWIDLFTRHAGQSG